jgi:hypothetical protein
MKGKQKMKIKPEHYQELKTRVTSSLTALTAGGLVSTKPPVALSLLWFCATRGENCCWLCKTLYPYASDTHIETALKRIGNELQGKDE